MTTTGTRTFDCPWCGAISPVPADHMGEHFSCSECRKATKLTEKNTSTRAPTDTPPDAPHLTGDRTFDCPWCGAISSVPSSHLGEAFGCPECARNTKLTSTNTRRATITAPPPDAPHDDDLASGGVGAKAFVAIALLVLGGGAAWWFTAGPGAAPATETVTNTVVAPDTGRKDVDSARPPTAPTSAPTPTAPTPGPAPLPGAPPAMEPAAPPPPAVPAPSDAEAERAALAKQAAAAKLLTADGAVEAAKSALEAWSKANPGAMEARELLPALAEASAEIDRVLADRALVPDPAKATSEQVRAADAAVRRFLEASPARAKVAAAVLEAMRSDRGGREVAGVSDWKDLHLTGDGFRRAAGSLTASWQALAGAVPADLVKALTDAVAIRDAARAEVDAAASAPGKAAAPTPGK